MHPSRFLTAALTAMLSLSMTAPSAAPAGNEALDYAFRFASSIRTDPKDMGRAQGQVLLDYASLGSTDQALRKADQVVGWNRGVVYAELAADEAKAGRRDQAKALLAKAEAVRAQTQGWEGPRIASHIAKALALLGDSKASRGLATSLEEADDQYAGLSRVAEAMSHAASGGFDEAMGALAAAAPADDPAAAGWRAEGYLEIARHPGLTPEQRRKALDAASGAIDLLKGWTKAGLLQDLATQYRAAGSAEKAIAALESAERILTALPPTAALKGPMLGSLARAWSEAGRPDHARALLRKAEEEASKTLAIDQPVGLASIAAAWFGLGDRAQADRVYDRALDATASLQNSRPRALAAVEICRSMGLSGMTLDPRIRSRLDRMYQGLGDPW